MSRPWREQTVRRRRGNDHEDDGHGALLAVQTRRGGALAGAVLDAVGELRGDCQGERARRIARHSPEQGRRRGADAARARRRLCSAGLPAVRAGPREKPRAASRPAGQVAIRTYGKSAPQGRRGPEDKGCPRDGRAAGRRAGRHCQPRERRASDPRPVTDRRACPSGQSAGRPIKPRVGLSGAATSPSEERSEPPGQGASTSSRRSPCAEQSECAWGDARRAGPGPRTTAEGHKPARPRGRHRHDRGSLAGARGDGVAETCCDGVATRARRRPRRPGARSRGQRAKREAAAMARQRAP